MKKYLIIFLVPLILGIIYINHKISSNSSQEINSKNLTAISEAQAKNILPPEKKTEVAVISGDVFDMVGERAGLDKKTCYALYGSTKSVYDLANLKAGRKFIFYYDDKDEINKIIYDVDTEQELTILRGASSTDWSAKLEKIVYEIKEKTVSGAIDSSLYESALAAGADEATILEFASSLEWAIDFANDPRVGDKYKFVYEERYRDGQFVMAGQVLAGAYLNDGKLLQTFYFEENDTNKGYFDENGNSVQKIFLKAPLAFKYISSPFTTGKRYIEAFNVSTGHRAIDYAAAAGTPIRAVGDGTVTFAGWNGGYGRFTSIRHNGTYSTNYGHQSKIIVKKGQHVTQGQVIGYVGSTGFSTGPHLHFEMVKNGVKVNPAKEILPPGQPIGVDRKADFMKVVDVMKEIIKIE